MLYHQFFAKYPELSWLERIYTQDPRKAVVAVKKNVENVKGVLIETGRVPVIPATEQLHELCQSLQYNMSAVPQMLGEYPVVTLDIVLAGLIRKNPFNGEAVSDKESDLYKMEVWQLLLFNFLVEIGEYSRNVVGNKPQRDIISGFLSDTGYQEQMLGRMQEAGAASTIAGDGSALERAKGWLWFNNANTPAHQAPAHQASAGDIGFREWLERMDDVHFDAMCLDHFDEVFGKFGRGQRHDEKVNLLLDHFRRTIPGWDNYVRNEGHFSKQFAGYGSNEVPAHIVNQLQDVRQNMFSHLPSQYRPASFQVPDPSYNSTTTISSGKGSIAIGGSVSGCTFKTGS